MAGDRLLVYVGSGALTWMLCREIQSLWEVVR